MLEKSKLVSVDAIYVTQKLEELMKHPIVQEVIYLQSILKASEVDKSPDLPEDSECDKEPNKE